MTVREQVRTRATFSSQTDEAQKWSKEVRIASAIKASKLIPLKIYFLSPHICIVEKKECKITHRLYRLTNCS